MHSQIRQFFDTENLSNFRLHQIQYYVKIIDTNSATEHRTLYKHTQMQTQTQLNFELHLIWSEV